MRRPLPAMRLPVMTAPMFLVSGPELVIEGCRAGLAAAFPTGNCRTLADLEDWMVRISTAVEDARRDAPPDRIVGPWAANLITHSTNARLKDDLDLVARYKPPLVITALGSPIPALEVVHGYGGLVFADVVNLKLARKAAAAGVDGLACISAGAGGHTGHLSPFAFISAVREFFDGYVAVGGGVADGAGVAGAVAAGADLVYMGTRFLAARESLAADDYKAMVVGCDADDLVVTPAVSGTAASWLKPSLIKAGYDPDNPGAAPDRNYASGDDALKRWRDIWAAGQGLHACRDVTGVADIADELERDYRTALARMARLAAA